MELVDFVRRIPSEYQLRFDDSTETNMINPRFTTHRISEHRSNTFDHRLFLWNQWVLRSILEAQQTAQ